jgi:hypothetical protein
MARTGPLSAALHALVGYVALLAALAFAAPAVAQDPAVDQYTPATPDGGGPVPTDPGSGAPSSFDGSGDDGSVGGAAPSDSTGDSGGDEGTSAAPTAAPATSTDPAPGGGGHRARSEQSGAERTIGAFAQQARDQRVARAKLLAADGATTDLSRSDGEDGTGMGVFLWVALGLTLLWAVASRNGRRRDAAPLT